MNYQVKNRFQNLPFKFNLQRYNTAGRIGARKYNDAAEAAAAAVGKPPPGEVRARAAHLVNAVAGLYTLNSVDP
jgi:hypothetical protein